ncbi:LysR family transcriptional regulator [Vibrio sp. WXL210]|uniref:LysR family transcriptional regulator n=1 Tax=Vibrio sp. WXL210 TaxID=3450709 RepID=UPI003EC6F8F9
MMTIDQLASFKAAYETSGYSAAGRVIGKDRATVREHVMALEDSIGKSLFTVVGKRLEPTSTADQLYPRAKHITKQMTDFERVALASFEAELNEIIIIHETLLPLTYLTHLETCISQRFPSIKIKLLHKNRRESMRALEQGEAHFALLTAQGDAFPGDAVGVSHLGVTQFAPYAHPSSPLFSRPEITLLDLAEEIQYVSENVDSINLNVLKHSNFQHIVSNNDLIVSLLESRGWSALNRLDARKYEQVGWLKELRLKELPQPYTINISLFDAYAFEANKTAVEVKAIILDCARKFLAGDVA